MALKPPPPEAGVAGLAAFRDAVHRERETLRTRLDRAFHRKELGRWQRLYESLATKREPGSAAADHFARLSELYRDLLAEYGEEAPPKKRVPKAAMASPLSYPDHDLRHSFASHGAAMSETLPMIGTFGAQQDSVDRALRAS